MLTLVIFGLLVTISSENLFVMWCGLEISTFFFTPYLGGGSMMKMSSVWKYYVIQSLGSLLLILSMFQTSEVVKICFIVVSTVLKLGLFPVIGWSLHVSENQSWSVLFIMSTLQKLPMLIITSSFMSGEEVFLFISITNFLIMTMIMFSQYSLRWMMMVSSSYNLSWMLVGGFVGPYTMLFYFFMYFIYLGLTMFMMKVSMSSDFWSVMNSSSGVNNLVSSLLICFLMGCPPLGTFGGKVEVLWGLIQEDMIVLGLLLIMCSGLVMYMYMKLLFNLMFISSPTFRSFVVVSLAPVIGASGLIMIYILLNMG